MSLFRGSSSQPSPLLLWIEAIAHDSGVAQACLRRWIKQSELDRASAMAGRPRLSGRSCEDSLGMLSPARYEQENDSLEQLNNITND